MSRTIRVDDEVFEKIQEHARPFEPVWKALRRALEMEVPADSVSMSDFEAELKKQEA